MIDLATEDAVAVLRDKHERNEHRAKLLVLLAALIASWGVLALTFRQNIIAAILHLADRESKLTTARLIAAKGIIESELAGFAKQVNDDFDNAWPMAEKFGAELAGKEIPSSKASEIAHLLYLTGPLGVPFSDVAVKDAHQVLTNLTGALTRVVLDNDKTIQAVTPEFKTAMDRLTNKLSHEAILQLNSAFVTVARETFREVSPALMLMFIATPAAERHCNWCGSKDGRIYRADDEVWGQLPKHRFCGCYGVPSKL